MHFTFLSQLDFQEILYYLRHLIHFTHGIVKHLRIADLLNRLRNGYVRNPAQLIYQSKSDMLSYLWSMASITLLVNLNGLAVDAITVLVSTSPVSFLYFHIHRQQPLYVYQSRSLSSHKVYG